MTLPDYTAIAVLMDRSGSMQLIKSDAEGAIRSFIADQRKVAGKCTIRLSEFDDTYQVVYPSTPIADAPDYTLTPRGTTALFDGIGRLVTDFGEELAGLPENERPGKVVVVVQTDGQENASKEWDQKQVFDLITAQREQYGWDFVFLGANQDAIKTGAGMGFAAGSSLTYTAAGTGTRSAGASVSNYVTQSRTVGTAAFSDADRQAAQS